MVERRHPSTTAVKCFTQARRAHLARCRPRERCAAACSAPSSTPRLRGGPAAAVFTRKCSHAGERHYQSRHVPPAAVPGPFPVCSSRVTRAVIADWRTDVTDVRVVRLVGFARREKRKPLWTPRRVPLVTATADRVLVPDRERARPARLSSTAAGLPPNSRMARAGERRARK